MNVPEPSQLTRLAIAPAEAARLAGISRTKLYELLGAGDLPSFTLGRRRLIRVAALEEWIRMAEAASQNA